MATIEKLKDHVKKSRSALDEGLKKAEDAKKSPEVRALKKKVKRLTRKVSKLVKYEKDAELRKKPKKERKAEAS